MPSPRAVQSLVRHLAVCILLSSSASLLADDSRNARPATWTHAAVAADHPLASEAGIEIMKCGGNVVDAAVATGFALSVLRPASSGIGGGGFMVIWDAQHHRAAALDYRERAPQAATREMFLPQPDGTTPSSEHGALAVAVPGHVAGLCFAQQKYGRLDLKSVLAPAIRYARDGIRLDEHDAEIRTNVAKELRSDSRRDTQFAALWRDYLANGEPLRVGQTVRSPQLAALELLAACGPDAFYRGSIAAAIVNTCREHGGILTAADLAAMDVVEREPLRVPFGNDQLITMPPPSSGGVALIQAVQIIEEIERGHLKRPVEALGHNTPPYLHVLTEAFKHAFADRAAFLGDPDFAAIPVQRLMSRSYAQQLAVRFNPHKTLAPEEYGDAQGRFAPASDHGTTHFSVIDAAGNAVACTETVNTTFGSWLVEPRYGIVLNNEMDDFTARPGQPNAFGLIQSEANAVGPRKKPLSSMTPTIVIRDGKALHALGASGGPRIISSTLQVLLNLTRFEMPPAQAIEAPRIHHQWAPDRLLIEPPLAERSQRQLVELGHSVRTSNELAVSQAVSRRGTVLSAKSDPRKHGRAAGF